MRRCRLGILLLILGLAAPGALAQKQKNKDNDYHSVLSQRVLSPQLSPPERLRDYVVDGKLQLRLRDAILLSLENNSSIRLEETPVENQKFALLGTYGPFDPKLQSIFSANRSSSPGYSQLQGVGISSNAILNFLTQSGQLSYTQLFQTGTTVEATLLSAKNSTNSGYYYVNPNFGTTLTLQFTQPLLRNRGLFPNRAPIVIARRNLQQSQATFRAQVSDTVLQVVTEYWQVVQAKGNLEVQQKSLESAEASYQRDKRALELGALPPLDIYRSESEVASRRVQVIQAEYDLKHSEDSLRLIVGANQDAFFQALDLDLTEKPEPVGALETADIETSLEQAWKNRPELAAVGYALANDDTSIRLAHNQLQPDLSLGGSYQTAGLGGNQYDLITGQLLARGGLGASFNQLFGFGYPSYGATLTLNLPVKNRSAQANLGIALVSRRSDLYAQRNFREQIALEVRDAVHQLEQAKLTLAAGETAVDLAEKSRGAEQRKYELGEGTIFFVLEAQTELARAELARLQSQVGYQLAIAAVDHATGNLLGPYLLEIDGLTH
jgi:HAE1 family hydrophobic/amphiphilic exporter-1